MTSGSQLSQPNDHHKNQLVMFQMHRCKKLDTRKKALCRNRESLQEIEIETDSAQQSFVVLLKTTSMQKMSHVGRED